MPLYDYECPKGHQFEEMNTVADRATATCTECGAIAGKRMVRPPRLDPFMPTPGAMMKWRKDAERRGRGADMTQANRTCGEQVQREAHAVRQALGENPIITSG